MCSCLLLVCNGARCCTSFCAFLCRVFWILRSYAGPVGFLHCCSAGSSERAGPLAESMTALLWPMIGVLISQRGAVEIAACNALLIRVQLQHCLACGHDINMVEPLEYPIPSILEPQAQFTPMERWQRKTAISILHTTIRQDLPLKKVDTLEQHLGDWTNHYELSRTKPEYAMGSSQDHGYHEGSASVHKHEGPWEIHQCATASTNWPLDNQGVVSDSTLISEGSLTHDNMMYRYHLVSCFVTWFSYE